MKPIVFTYCEGSDTKVAVVVKEKESVKVLKTAAFDVVHPSMTGDEDISTISLDSEIGIEGLDDTPGKVGDSLSFSNVTMLNDALKGININKCEFIPTLTEPAIYYHTMEGQKGKSSKLTQEIVDDIQMSKNVKVSKDNLGYVELSDKSILSVFLGGDVNCIQLIDSLARHNGKRYYKIPSVKSAEISLAYYVAKRKKFFPDDHSLIVYIGKEYSKLIFLHGRKLKHIGATLDIGTLNLHTYDVYFSKVLLEMENSGISSLDNIIVCGEDDSENLILSFYGTFPEANVSRLDFDDLNLSSLSTESKEKFSAFSVPIAAAYDYFDELEGTHQGINLLPRYVKEEQKIFQFGWHGYAVLPLLFVVTFYLTQIILNNQKEINQLDDEIATQTVLKRQNEEILNNISNLETKINSFGQTQAILDSASAGTGVWTDVLGTLSDFFASKKDIWLTKLTTDESNNVILDGYALNKNVLTDLAYFLKTAKLKGVYYEALREKNAYRFNLVFNLDSYYKDTK